MDKLSRRGTHGKDILGPEARARYERQLIMPEIGEAGQQALHGATVCVVGLGGLGSISALYLAAAGVGTIRVIDGDRVDRGNLNRQILYETQHVGAGKVETGARRLSRLNPEVTIEPVHETLTEKNGLGLTDGCEVLIDGTDNRGTRVVLNRISLERHIPFIYGGVDGFRGMVTTFVPGETPCFECLFPNQQETTRTIGVIGPVPGCVAAIQAAEAVKWILGMDGLLNGRLLYMDFKRMRFKEMALERNPDCRICR
jgi:adenylyltransferase/sulfurtransferase